MVRTATDVHRRAINWTSPSRVRLGLPRTDGPTLSRTYQRTWRHAEGEDGAGPNRGASKGGYDVALEGTRKARQTTLRRAAAPKSTVRVWRQEARSAEAAHAWGADPQAANVDKRSLSKKKARGSTGTGDARPQGKAERGDATQGGWCEAGGKWVDALLYSRPV